jgi:serine/threonine protein kinase
MPQKGDIIAGRFELLEPIGKGGQGVVWTVLDYTDKLNAKIQEQPHLRSHVFHPNLRTYDDGPIGTNRSFDMVSPKPEEIRKANAALKFLINPDAKAIERFKLDYSAVKSLDDPRIIRYKDCDIPMFRNSDDPAWILMEYIDGGNLDDLIKVGSYRLDILGSLNLIEALLKAIDRAHTRDPQIIHRDLKPANILLRSDLTPVIADFGICHFIDDKHISLSSTGEEVGARNYIAPELRGTKQLQPSPQSDYYSLAKVLYFMLSGGEVMDDESYDSENWDLRRDEGFSQQINYIYDRIFPKTICKDPNERFRNGNDFLSEIQKITTLVFEHYYPYEEGRKCIFCGEGHYICKAKPRWTEKVDWRFVCDNCGNVQYFQGEGAPGFQRVKKPQ